MVKPFHHPRPVGHIQTWRQASLDRDPANPRPAADRSAFALAQFLPQAALYQGSDRRSPLRRQLFRRDEKIVGKIDGSFIQLPILPYIWLMNLECLLIADDLTGACDAAVQLCAARVPDPRSLGFPRRGNQRAGHQRREPPSERGRASPGDGRTARRLPMAQARILFNKDRFDFARQRGGRDRRRAHRVQLRGRP